MIELDNFRSKYPQYADISDADLANKLASKYPDAYGDLPKKLSGISDINPSEKIPMAGPVGYGIERGLKAVKEGMTAADAPSVAAKSLNSSLFGVPKIIADRPMAAGWQGMDTSMSLFPKPATKAGAELGDEMALYSALIPSMMSLQKIVAPAARKGAETVSNRLMTSVLKPSIRQLRKEPKIGFKAAKMGLSGDKGKILAKAEEVITKNEKALEGIIDNSKGSVDVAKIADTLDDLKRPFSNTGDDASVAVIEKLQNVLKGKGTISVKEANQLKKDFYSGLKDTAYGQGTSKLGASIKAEKAAARGLKEGVEKAEPSKPIADLNKRTSVAGMVRDAVSRQELLDNRRNMMGLIDTGLFGGAMGTGNPMLWGTLLAKKAIGSDAVKSKLAELLARMV